MTRIVSCTINYFKSSQSRLPKVILFLGVILVLYFISVSFHWDVARADACNPTRLNATTFHSVRHDNHPCNSQINDGRQWQYKNGIDGSWHCWLISNPVTTYSQTNSKKWTVKWFNRAPANHLGVIVYLTQRSELQKLNMSLFSLRRYLFKSRPVVIFHEDDLDDINIQSALANTLGSDIPLGFEHVRFPNRVNTAHDHRYALGYHHMCRFFSIMLPHHPLLTNMFTFYWRLDSDSHLLGPSQADDLFDYMNENRFQYAFTMVEVDAREYVEGLWELFHKFLAHFCLTPSPAVRRTQTTFFSGSYSLSIFYNNLELSNASIWRDEPHIAAWLRKVDEAKGIYSHRWGDAPIRTLAITQFLERDQIVKLRDVGYFHRREYVCADGIHPCVVPSHLEASANRPFPKGCHPASNPLCQYYPEKRRR